MARAIIEEKERRKPGLAAGGERSKCGCRTGEWSRVGMKSGRFERTYEGLAAELAGFPACGLSALMGAGEAFTTASRHHG